MGMAKKRVHRPEGYRPLPPPEQRQKARPTQPGPAARRPDNRDLRTRFEDTSAQLLLRMQSLPVFLVPVILGVLLFLGLALNPAWSGLLLIVIALFLLWLTAVSWPSIGTGSRVLRLVVDFAILGLGVLKLLDRLP